MLEETRRTKKITTKKIQSKTKSKKINKQTNKQTKPFGASYKRNEWKKIKAIQKEDEIRKAVRTQRWRLRIKQQKDNTEKQPTVPEDNTFNSRPKYDREKKEQ